MNSRYQIIIGGPIDLRQPISIILDWDGEGASLSDTVDRYKRTLDIFEAHLHDGAFPREIDTSESTLVPVKGELLIQEHKFEIIFPFFPFQVQSLRLLIRALLYPHCQVGSQVEVLVSGTSFGGNYAKAPFLLRSFQDLDKPLIESPVPFPSSTQWCYKNITLSVEFPNIVDEKAVEILDQIVANWAIFGNLGAYATSDQLENFDEDEEIGMFLDIPVVGEDFVEWSVTQLNVKDECVVSLLNMLVAFHYKETKIGHLQIS